MALVGHASMGKAQGPFGRNMELIAVFVCATSVNIGNLCSLF